MVCRGKWALLQGLRTPNNTTRAGIPLGSIPAGDGHVNQDHMRFLLMGIKVDRRIYLARHLYGLAMSYLKFRNELYLFSAMNLIQGSEVG